MNDEPVKTQEERSVLVLFSGGLDSTYLVYDHLKNGRTVNLLYVDGGQGKPKIKAERKARGRILRYLHQQIEEGKLTGRIGILTDATYTWTNNGEYTHSFCFSQVFPWFAAALQHTVGTRHCSVQIAYVLGDQISSELYRLQNAWELLYRAIKSGDYVPLEFPLMRWTKQDILGWLPPELRALVWVCELPELQDRPGKKPKHVACKSCGGCKRWAAENYVFQGEYRSKTLEDEVVAQPPLDAGESQELTGVVTYIDGTSSAVNFDTQQEPVPDEVVNQFEDDDRRYTLYRSGLYTSEPLVVEPSPPLEPGPLRDLVEATAKRTANQAVEHLLAATDLLEGLHPTRFNVTPTPQTPAEKLLQAVQGYSPAITVTFEDQQDG